MRQVEGCVNKSIIRRREGARYPRDCVEVITEGNARKGHHGGAQSFLIPRAWPWAGDALLRRTLLNAERPGVVCVRLLGPEAPGGS